jgi:hypothetical protein
VCVFITRAGKLKKERVLCGLCCRSLSALAALSSRPRLVVVTVVRDECPVSPRRLAHLLFPVIALSIRLLLLLSVFFLVAQHHPASREFAFSIAAVLSRRDHNVSS